MSTLILIALYLCMLKMVVMELPNFDELVNLAKNEPEKFDAMRQQLNQQLIALASDEQQKVLEGLVFKIEMQRRKSKNTTQFNILLSQLMISSFVEMQSLLNSETKNKQLDDLPAAMTKSNVIHLPQKKI